MHSSSVFARQAKLFLPSTGWSLSNTTWTHASGMVWHLEKFSFPDYKHKVAHLLREGWRRKQWDALGTGKRRDSTVFRNTSYSEDRVTLVRKIARASQGPQLAILLGSVPQSTLFHSILCKQLIGLTAEPIEPATAHQVVAPLALHTYPGTTGLWIFVWRMWSRT